MFESQLKYVSNGQNWITRNSVINTSDFVLLMLSNQGSKKYVENLMGKSWGKMTLRTPNRICNWIDCSFIY